MSAIKKNKLFDMLKAGNIIGFENEVVDDIVKYLDGKFNENIIFEEHNYRIGKEFSNLIDFPLFKETIATSVMKDVLDKENKVTAKKYYEYKVIELESSVAILVANIIVINDPIVESFYDMEAKLYVFKKCE